MAAPAAAAGLKLLLDEMYPPEIARQLRRHGHDVVAVGERPDDRGRPDVWLIERASDESRAVVTNNHKHHVPLFSRTLADVRDHPGLLLTSDHSLPRTRRGIGPLVRTLDRFLRAHPADDALRNRLLWLP